MFLIHRTNVIHNHNYILKNILRIVKNHKRLERSAWTKCNNPECTCNMNAIKRDRSRNRVLKRLRLMETDMHAPQAKTTNSPVEEIYH